MPWKRPGRILVRALSSQSVPLGASISQCNATSPLATAGVCWWTRGDRCLGPPRGMSPPTSPSHPSLSCPSVGPWGKRTSFLLGWLLTPPGFTVLAGRSRGTRRAAFTFTGS